MASFFLIVGVGGGGRGILNHLKYDLEQEYGSAQAARTRLVCIDGPETDQYILPGEFQIDTHPGSPEFICTEVSPAPTLQRIAREEVGPPEKQITSWLSPAEAAKIPASALNPLTGLGGERVPGHILFYLQLDDLQQRLLQAYQQSRAALSGDQASDRVVVILMGSLAGGTGAGLLWDIAHLLREPTAGNQDPLLCLLPLPNTYHPLLKSEGERVKHDAKNFAGIRELARFMTASHRLPTRMTFSDTIAIENGQLFDVPFLADGDRPDSKVNDVIPQWGIVPAMADFLLALIQDNLATHRPIYNALVNWGTAHIGGAPTPAERFGSFGVSSLRYPWKEVLGSFAYRFAYELYEAILEPIGEAVEAGRLRATRTLNDCPFTTMVENPATARMAPADYRQLASRVSTGRTGSLPFPTHDPLVEEIKHGGFWFLKVPDEEVIRNAEELRDRYLGGETDLSSSTVRGWMNLQSRKILELFFGTDRVEGERSLGLIEREVLRLFFHPEGEHLSPIPLSESPHSLVIARDYLQALWERLGHFADHWEAAYRGHLYPEGDGRPSLLALQIERVDRRREAMHRNPKDTREEQEVYLQEAQKLMELEIWAILVKGIGDLVRSLRERLDGLWALIGDDADGWVNILEGYKELMDRCYTRDITRRQGFTALKLRRYLPNPGGLAEDQLFEDVADPALNELLRQISWEFTVDPKDPARYRLLLCGPQVPGYQYQAHEGALLNAFTRERLGRVNRYNPYEHVQYALNVLQGPLSQKTLWDMLWYDYAYEWRQQAENREKGPDDYVRERLDWLMERSEVLLNYTTSPTLHAESYLFGKFLTASGTDNPAHDLAARFVTQLAQKGVQRTDDDLYAKELRRVNVELKIPLTSWSGYEGALEHYLEYHQVPSNTLVHIYPNEQNAFRIEALIARKIDRSFAGKTLDPTVVALLDSPETFRTFALCLIDGQIPSRAEGLAAPRRHFLSLPNGEVDLGEIWDIDTLVSRVWGDRGVQEALASRWHQREAEAQRQNQTQELLQELEGKLKGFAFPSAPTGTRVAIDLGHLLLAFRAVVGEYVEQVRGNLVL